MERFFQILAAILAGVAAYFLWHGNAERAFVAAVGGAVSFFLSVRVQVRRRLNEREKAEEEKWRRGEEESEEEGATGRKGDAEMEDEIGEDEISNSGTFELNEMSAEEQIRNEQRTTDNEPKI